MTICYDPEQDVLDLFGVKYAASMFRHLAFGPPGVTFQIVSRGEDGSIVLKRLAPGDSVPEHG